MYFVKTNLLRVSCLYGRQSRDAASVELFFGVIGKTMAQP